MELACLALVFENEGREKGNSTPAVKGVWGKSTYSSGSRVPNSWKQQCNRKAQFWGQDIQTLDPAGLSMDFYFIWTSQSQRAHVKLRLCRILWTLHCASIFQWLFNHWSAGSTLEKSGFSPFSAHILINFVIHSIICAALFLKISWKQTFRRLFSCPWVLVQSRSTKKVEVQKKNSRKGKLNEKNSCTPIYPKIYSCYGLKKIHTRNLLTKKNSGGSKIPLPP